MNKTPKPIEVNSSPTEQKRILSVEEQDDLLEKGIFLGPVRPFSNQREDEDEKV
jgi:hypothetical protein